MLCSGVTIRHCNHRMYCIYRLKRSMLARTVVPNNLKKNQTFFGQVANGSLLLTTVQYKIIGFFSIQVRVRVNTTGNDCNATPLLAGRVLHPAGLPRNTLRSFVLWDVVVQPVGGGAIE